MFVVNIFNNMSKILDYRIIKSRARNRGKYQISHNK